MRRNFQVLDITQQLSAEQIQQRQNKLQTLYVVPTQKSTPSTVYLRDGEVVLYKRERSAVWQARFRLYDKKWHSVSTKHYNLEFASRAACEIYDEARFRERMGVSHTCPKMPYSSLLLLAKVSVSYFLLASAKLFAFLITAWAFANTTASTTNLLLFFALVCVIFIAFHLS